MKTKYCTTVVGIVACWVWSASAGTNLAITSFQGGYLTWTNVDSDLFYTVEWQPCLNGTDEWVNTYSQLRDIRSTNSSVTRPVPVFMRVVGNRTPVDCRTCGGILSEGGRWCDAGDGTVRDTTTDLRWLKKTDWGGLKPWQSAVDYDDAHLKAGTLEASTPGADLSDGSVQGDWRLPTKNELLCIRQGPEAIGASNTYFFTGVQAAYYWSSTTISSPSSAAWVVHPTLTNGPAENGYYKTDSAYVWPVRNGP